MEINNIQKIAVIVAAGNGSRMNSDIPKQFLLLKGKPVLYYTIRAFLNAYSDMKIILVLASDHIQKGREIIDGFFDDSRIIICDGGDTRFESVKNGLRKINKEAIVFVHDGVRCLVSEKLIKRCFDGALEFGNAVPATPCHSSVRLLEDGENKILDRSALRLVQTPQTFHSKILIPSFEIPYKEQFTDEASVVEAFGLKINLVEGEETNFKITTPLDLLLAGQLID